MSDPLVLPRVDPLPERDPRGSVTPSRDRQPRKRREPPRQQPADQDTEDDDRQVGRRLDVRA